MQKSANTSSPAQVDRTDGTQCESECWTNQGILCTADSQTGKSDARSTRQIRKLFFIS